MKFGWNGSHDLSQGPIGNRARVERPLACTGAASALGFLFDRCPRFSRRRSAGDPARTWNGSPQAAGGATPKGATTLPQVEIVQEPPKPAAPAETAKPKPKPRPLSAPAATPAPRPKTVARPVAPPPSTEPPAAAVAAPSAPAGSVEAGYIKFSPIGGSEIPIGKVPGGVATVSAKDIDRTGAVTVQEALQARVPGIVLGDLQGNAFQTDIQYRGFQASPVNGVAQGLAVYQNGVRINEAFGDIVNLDFLPSNAINDITVVAGNPVFGLNAVGGAISIGMKDGFNYHGAEVDARFGSFGRRQVSAQAGVQSGPFAVYGALEGIHDDGFRDFSSSNIRRLYADIGAKGSLVEAHVNVTGARNDVGVVAASPLELLATDFNRTFTSPQTTRNELEMVSANVSVKPTSTLTISGDTYYRHFKQSHIDGNIGDFTECAPPLNGFLCGDTDTNPYNGGTIPFDATAVYGSIDRTSTDSHSYGAALQAVEKSKLFGLGNQFLVGASFDHGKTNYAVSSELGTFGQLFVVNGTGTTIADADGNVTPRGIRGTNDYSGIYFSDTLDITPRLAFTFGGRFNYARIQLDDVLGTAPDVTGSNNYSRFNPIIGATYKLTPTLSLYGGYSEANRAPTPAELACSDPNKPCIIESFLTSDPPLKQVVSRTVEAGLRGEVNTRTGREKVDWSLGVFHTENTDDIYTVFSAAAGRGYFTNIGNTLRQGIEAAASYRSDKLFFYANYSYVDATFQTALQVDSPNNPLNPSPGDDFVTDVAKGSKLPGVPAHKLKVGFDYWLTDKWKFGSDVIVTSDQYYIGDEANQNAKLPGYQRLDLHTSYDVTSNIQLYGIAQNVIDSRYGLTGTYFNVPAANGPAALNGQTFTDPRAVTPAAPFAIYGGVKVKM